MTDERVTDVQRDPQIADAYRRLSTALAPPPDLAVRVERRAGVRRRRRRAAAAGVAGVVAASVVGGAVLLGGGGQDVDNVAVDGTATGSFVLTRADGSTYTWSELKLTCQDPYPVSEGAGSPGPQRILLYSPRAMSEDGKTLDKPLVYFSGIVDQIAGRTFQLPLDAPDSDQRAFVLFVADPDVGPAEERANEVSSAEPGAAGTVVVGRASCDPTPVLELEAVTTLGSEVNQGTLDLNGSFG